MMGLAKKLRKRTKLEEMSALVLRVKHLLKQSVNNESLLLRAMYEYTRMTPAQCMPSYAKGVLVQVYGKGILDHLEKEAETADKIAKGLDKVVLTGTEAME